MCVCVSVCVAAHSHGHMLVRCCSLNSAGLCLAPEHAAVYEAVLVGEAELQQEVGKRFDPTEALFTLEKVFSLGLHAHADMIGEMSANANKSAHRGRSDGSAETSQPKSAAMRVSTRRCKQHAHALLGSRSRPRASRWSVHWRF